MLWDHTLNTPPRRMCICSMPLQRLSQTRTLLWRGLKRGLLSLKPRLSVLDFVSHLWTKGSLCSRLGVCVETIAAFVSCSWNSVQISCCKQGILQARNTASKEYCKQKQGYFDVGIKLEQWSKIIFKKRQRSPPALFPGHLQILSRSCGAKLDFISS